MRLNPINQIDFYKADHRRQYPPGTEYVYSNFTPRSSKLSNLPQEFRDGVVFFGLQHLMQSFLIDTFRDGFFNKPASEVVGRYHRRMKTALGVDMDMSHIEALHDLGYLPIEIKALKEGTVVPYGVPCFTIINTKPEFFWLVNYLETVLSNMLWKPCTSATTARFYRRLFESAAYHTGAPRDLVPFQAHDFSFRGMAGPEDAAISGAGHLTSFVGTDTIPAIDLIEDYYYGDADHELIGCSVPATEHSVMCMGTKDNEIGTFERLITEVYPAGIVSVVSDTWDFWKVVTEYLPALKDKIMARNGTLVIRPDSGDPVKILCGDRAWPDLNSPISKGLIQCLWETFGGTKTEKGFRVLDRHVGAIYGDSITPDRAVQILTRLAEKGFASSNVVLGVGSFTYEHVTRDTHGFAMKATWGVVNGEARDIFKEPKTDSGTKKSHRGLLRVYYSANKITVMDQANPAWLKDSSNLLQPVFRDGQILSASSIGEIRRRVEEGLELDEAHASLFPASACLIPSQH